MCLFNERKKLCWITTKKCDNINHVAQFDRNPCDDFLVRCRTKHFDVFVYKRPCCMERNEDKASVQYKCRDVDVEMQIR